MAVYILKNDLWVANGSFASVLVSPMNPKRVETTEVHSVVCDDVKGRRIVCGFHPWNAGKTSYSMLRLVYST